MELCKISGSTAFQSGRLPKHSVIRMTGTEFRPQNRMFIAGMGFVGQRLGRELKNQGWDVSGTCTSINKKKKLEEERSFQIYLFDANEPDVIILDAIKNHTHMVVSIPPVPGIGDPMLHYEQILRTELVGGKLQWLGYLSSTSVYGDTGGAWVDEDYIPNPTSESGRLRLAAEEGWFNFSQSLGISTQVFRLGGIYGPGRSAVDTIVKQGALSESQRMRGHKRFTSRVSVDDICQAIMASICTPSSSRRRVYNIVDDDPAPREEVFEYARDLVEKKWPGWIKQPSEQKESLVIANKRGLRGEKRASNARMKNELGVRLLHPSYRSGLQSIIEQMDSPFEHGKLNS
ncbi:protein YeeZ isoform X1 [Pyrus x bretschneideri]|uniref:protein YeeZ isoform X1 n=1 Tax=Pyrus x bretschneideri TaxID=225117 RepID=UPI00202F5A8C|nr:protein YeeZ isoform X1 [Pyrus x bretschneideri]